MHDRIGPFQTYLRIERRRSALTITRYSDIVNDFASHLASKPDLSAVAEGIVLLVVFFAALVLYFVALVLLFLAVGRFFLLVALLGAFAFLSMRRRRGSERRKRHRARAQHDVLDGD